MALPSAGAPHAAAAADGQAQAAAAQGAEPASPMHVAARAQSLQQEQQPQKGQPQEQQQQPPLTATSEAGAQPGNAPAPAPLPGGAVANASGPWHLARTSIDEALAQAEVANASETSEKVVIAVVDSGYDTSHKLLRGRVADTRNAFDKSKDVKDRMGHGTNVAITAAQADPNAVLLVCKNLDVKRQGRGFVHVGSTVETIDCLLWAASKGANIILMSQITRTNAGNLRSIIRELERRGIMVVAAAGNDGEDLSKAPVYPAAWAPDLTNVITVAGSTRDDALSRDSNYGRPALLAAPGEDIAAATDFGGTSAAAPQVAAAMSLVQRICNAGYPINPALWVEMFTASVDQVDALEGRVASGGRLNAAALLEECLRRRVVQEQPPTCLQSALPCKERCDPFIRCTLMEGQGEVQQGAIPTAPQPAPSETPAPALTEAPTP